jgi:hypothetical protein
LPSGWVLEAKTSEKLWIEAGPEFGKLQGRALVIFKALCGLQSSGARWHERCTDCLCEMGFVPSKAKAEIWMHRNGDVCEHAAICVDDLAVVAKGPKAVADALINKHNFKLKGTGPISFHLGCDFFRDEHGCLCMAPRKRIEKMVATCEQMLGIEPRQDATSPLNKGDHPETDMSEELDQKGVTQCQSLIGAMQHEQIRTAVTDWHKAALP